MRLCRHLRWKTWYGARWDTPEELLADLTRNDVPFTCLRTCLPFGADDGPAVPEACRPERACFEPSAKEPLPQRAPST